MNQKDEMNEINVSNVSNWLVNRILGCNTCVWRYCI